MEKVKEFMQYFIGIEKNIEVSLRNRNLIEHNILVDKIIEISGKDIFLAEKQYEPLSMITEMIIKENGHLAVIPRHLFKISEYAHKKYGTVWACYVSIPNPSTSIKKLTTCFLLAEIEKDLKIIVKMGFESDTHKWTFYGGDDDKSLRIHNLGIPVKVERYLEPTDEWSLEEYLKNK